MAQNDGAERESPIVRFSFDEPVVGTWIGKAKIETTTLRGPAFPGLSPKNQAAYLNGKTYLRVKENDHGNLRFNKGESITIEAWVNPDPIKDKAYVYIVGKGRSDNPEFPAENQNYALRLFGSGGDAKITFLFRSQKQGNQPEEYHRWTSKNGFTPGTGWHHVALTYTFGEPRSIRGYIDGNPSLGSWDMGGATDRAPVVDGDDVILGSAKGGSAGNTYRGWLDEVAIYRVALSDSTISRHALRIVEAPKIDFGAVAGDKVRVEICENGVPPDTWPQEPLAATETYDAPALAFFGVPHKYIDTGIRADRANPYQLRALTKIDVPAGKHRLLLRGRGASRLYVNGKLTLTTPFRPSITDGHSPIPKNYLDLGPDFRFAPPGNREAWTHLESKGGPHVFVLETLVGGRKGNGIFRPEIGETVVALAREGSETFYLIAPNLEVAYTDEGWKPFADKEEARIAQLNADRRAAALAQHAGWLGERRKLAQEWLAATKDEPVPPLPKGYPAFNAVDHFVAAKIEAARLEVGDASNPGRKSVASTVDFARQVLPILEAKCFSCHQGQKVKGKLRLDSLAGMLKGGASGEPAIVRGTPEKSPLIARIVTNDESEVMPPQGDRLTKADVKILETWIKEGAAWNVYGKLTLSPLTDDLAFLRRVTLDTVGVVPSSAEIADFLADTRPDKRTRAIDRLLDDPRWADHWVGYWQDALAENPNILNPTLNNSGPFRWWIHEALLDNKPMDLFVTELIRMRGSAHLGGPAGFGIASQNDVPLADKGIILASAFLGVPMKCARCHDAPAHKSTQKELFQIAASLKMEPIVVPKTSSVPKDKLHGTPGRKPLITVTLQPGTKVEPAWPFAEALPKEALARLLPAEATWRDQFAARVTAPHNERFALVLANRLWQRLMGRGIVEPIDDWEKGQPSHPELLRWLGRELVRVGYDYKKLARIILLSHAYQRAVDPELREPSPLFVAPAKRPLQAEQIVDSLFAAAGKAMETEEINLDIDSGRDIKNSLSLGKPKRSWMLASTSNERDRPSLALPRVQAVVDVLEAFGWRGARQDPRTTRESAANVLQPAILANGTMTVWLTRLSEDHAITQLALDATSPDDLVDRLFLRILTRRPRPDERTALVEYLTPGFKDRIRSLTPEPLEKPAKREFPKYLSWSNHLTPEANSIKIQLETAARRGAPPTTRLTPEWRVRMEDAVWSLLNAPEFVFVP